MTDEIKKIKAFISSQNPRFIANKFTGIDKFDINSISEKRFYSYLAMLEESLPEVESGATELESIISYMVRLEEKSKRQLIEIIKNEQSKAMFHLIGKINSEKDEMEVVSSNGFIYSEKDNGWVFE